jgi:hypothetical protein
MLADAAERPLAKRPFRAGPHHDERVLAAGDEAGDGAPRIVVVEDVDRVRTESVSLDPPAQLADVDKAFDSRRLDGQQLDRQSTEPGE